MAFFGIIVNVIVQKLKSKHLVRLSFSGEKIERIHYAESSGHTNYLLDTPQKNENVRQNFNNF